MNQRITPAGSSRASTWALLAVISAWGWLAAGCQPGPKSAWGFRLPDGNVADGQATFVKLQCTTCHTVTGLELPPPGSKSPITVALGGEVTRIRTYGDLVTSIINPSHIISDKYQKQLEGAHSPMPQFNRDLTVGQLIDLVAFLQPRYKTIQVDHLLVQ